MVIAGTGHRPEKLGGYGETNPLRDWIKSAIAGVLDRDKPEVVYTGMGLGFDEWLAEVCVALEIPFIAIVPFRGWSTRWPTPTQRRIRSLLFKAKEVIVLSEANRVSRSTAVKLLMRRNRVLVEKLRPPADARQCSVPPQDYLLACWDGSESGGTYNTVMLAEDLGIHVERIDPRNAPGYTRDLAYVNQRSSR